MNLSKPPACWPVELEAKPGCENCRALLAARAHDREIEASPLRGRKALRVALQDLQDAVEDSAWLQVAALAVFAVVGTLVIVGVIYLCGVRGW